jgi:hypothetical protein
VVKVAGRQRILNQILNQTEEDHVSFRKLAAACLIVTAFLISGCMSVSYKPAVSLGESPRTVNANARLEKFVDRSPASDQDTKFGGASATAPGTLAGDLETEITDAIFSDFSNNQLFASIKKRTDDPDLVLKGTINRFNGTSGPNAGFWATLPIDIIWFFGIPILSDDGVVDLTIEAYKRDNSLVGKYEGKCHFGENYTVYNNPIFGLQSRMNRCFSDAVKQIRDGIIADEGRLEPTLAKRLN